jgi:hypothetical protein
MLHAAGPPPSRDDLPALHRHPRRGLMPDWAVIAVAVAALAVLAGIWVVRRRWRRHPVVGTLLHATDATQLDSSGAVRSVQAADLVLPSEALEAIWSPMHLERLARTYWRFLARCTLGLIRVVYGADERFVVLLARPFVLLRFQAPEYELDGERGLVRWRIERGVLVSRRGRGGNGYLQIEVRRHESDEPGCAVAHVEVEVANFYPAIASRLGAPLYRVTQSRLHVLITHGFLRSLARLDLAESRVGRFDPGAADETEDLADPAQQPRG